MGARLIPMYKEDLTTGQAARYCGVSPQTIVNWCQMGRLNWTRIESGPRRIPKSEVRTLLEKNGIPVPDALALEMS